MLRRILVPVLSFCVALWVFGDPTLAQSRARIFDVQLNEPVSLVPTDEWVDPACGTNGGPPSRELKSFDEFALCPVEPETGLHEVWFIYDDEWEYIARAYRDPVEIGRFSANVFYGQPIITSLLVDDAGLVQGYRVVTDPRAADTVRIQAYLLHAVFKTTFGNAVWECEDLPREERETPVAGVFLKQDCAGVTAEMLIRIEGRHIRKPGQDRFAVAPESYFESSARLEVFNLAAVTGAPCCRASLSR